MKSLKDITEKLEEDCRAWLDSNYPGCSFPVNCEYCKFVGNAFWHCKNPKSHKQSINVYQDYVCEHWSPNEGLMIFLWTRHVKKELGEVNE